MTVLFDLAVCEWDVEGFGIRCPITESAATATSYSLRYSTYRNQSLYGFPLAN